MSIYAMTTVWEHSKQSGGDLLVMLALADYADDRGRAWPAVETLAKKARKDRRTVQRILRKLEDAGEIGPVGKTKAGVVVWQLADFEGRQNAGAAKCRPRQNDHGGGGKNAAPGAVKMPPNPSVKPLPNPHRDDDQSKPTSTSTPPAAPTGPWPPFMQADEADRALVLAAGYEPAKVTQRVAWAAGRLGPMLGDGARRAAFEARLRAEYETSGKPVDADRILALLPVMQMEAVPA